MMNVVGTIIVYLVLLFGVSEECNPQMPPNYPTLIDKHIFESDRDKGCIGRIEFDLLGIISKRSIKDRRKFHVEIDYDGNNQHKTPLNPCVFNPYDLNGNDYITKSDLEKIFVYFNDGTNTPEILHNFFTELDIDEDNVVTREEFNIMRVDVISQESCNIRKDKDENRAEKKT